LENLKRGTALHIKGLNENCTREDLRELFDDYKVIRWVNYMKGQPEANLRFAEENDAKVALEELLKAKDGNVELKGSKLEIRLLEGDEELEYLKKELKEEGARLSSAGRGRRQKGRGGHRKNNGNFNKNKRKNASRDGKASDGEENENGADGNDEDAKKKLKTVN
jgi:RNA recognition motif-containing protein